MNFISKTIGNRATTYVLAGMTALAAATTIKSATNDYINNYETGNTIEKTQTENFPISDETKGYATLFTLGLLGTGAVANQRKKINKQEKEIKKAFSGKNFRIQFLDKNKLTLVDLNNCPIAKKEYTLNGFNQEQLTEIVAQALDTNYVPKTVKEKDLERPEVKAFQEEINLGVKYSRESITERIMQESLMNPYTASSDSLTIHEVIKNAPTSIKEECIKMYMEKGRKYFCPENMAIMSTYKLINELLKNHGITIDYVEEEDSLTSGEENLAIDDKETEEDADKVYANVYITKADGTNESHRIIKWSYPEFLEEQVNKLS